MTAVIFLVTLGGIMVYSALKGISIPDVMKGVIGNTLDPKGGFHPGSPQGTGDANSSGTGNSDLPHGGTGHYGFRGPHAAALTALADIAQKQFHLTVTSTTGGTHVHGSYHYLGRAFDANGATSDMAAYFDYVAENYGASITELFYDPRGAIKNGKHIPAIGGHVDHVHTAL